MLEARLLIPRDPLQRHIGSERSWEAGEENTLILFSRSRSQTLFVGQTDAGADERAESFCSVFIVR